MHQNQPTIPALLTTITVMKFLFRGTAKSTAAAAAATEDSVSAVLAVASSNEAAMSSSESGGSHKSKKGLFPFMTRKSNPVTNNSKATSSRTSSRSKPPSNKQGKQQKRRQSLVDMDVPGSGSGSGSGATTTVAGLLASTSGLAPGGPTSSNASSHPPSSSSHGGGGGSGSGFGSLLRYSRSRSNNNNDSHRSRLTSSTTTNSSRTGSTRGSMSSHQYLVGGSSSRRSDAFHNNPTHSSLVAEYTALIQEENERVFQQNERERAAYYVDDSETFQPTVITATTYTSGTTTLGTTPSGYFQSQPLYTTYTTTAAAAETVSSPSPFSPSLSSPQRQRQRQRPSLASSFRVNNPMATVEAVEEGSKEDTQSSHEHPSKEFSSHEFHLDSSHPPSYPTDTTTAMHHHHLPPPLEDVYHIHCPRHNHHQDYQIHHRPEENYSLRRNDSRKDHAFQLIPHAHPELGMLHSDYPSVHDALVASQQQSQQLQHLPLEPIPHINNNPVQPQPQQSPALRPIVCVQAEIPGNVYAGKTIFAHPLIVEALETYFVVVATPLSTLEQNVRPTLSSVPVTNQQGGNSNREPPVAVTTTSTSKMGGNYVYTRVRILDPWTGYDLVPCLDHHLSRASLLQAMLDALAMVCPQQSLPRYVGHLLEEERAKRLYSNRQRHNSILNRTATAAPLTYNHHHPSPTYHHSLPVPASEPSVSDLKHLQAPVAIFGMEHTALGEVAFAGLDGVVSTIAAWVLPKVEPPPSPSQNQQLSQLPSRKAVICIHYDPQKLTYCTLAKFAIELHYQHKLGRPSGLTLYYKSNEEHMAAQMHTRAHYRKLMEQVDPTNPAQYYYNNHNFGGGIGSTSHPAADLDASNTSTSTTTTTNTTPQMAHETIRILPLQPNDDESTEATLEYETSNDSSSDESYTGLNNSANKTHPGYKVPDYDGVVDKAAAKAAAEAGKEKPIKYSFVLKPICSESLQLQGSKPSLRESHLRFVPLTPYQATRANQLVFEGKFHLAMKLLSPRQGMLLMHALRSGKPRNCGACPTAGDRIENGSEAAGDDGQPQETSSSHLSRSSFTSLRSTASTDSKGKLRRRKSGAAPGTPTKTKELSPKAPPNSRPLSKARRRRASAAEISSKPVPRFPKQAPGRSLNPDAMRDANAVRASIMLKAESKKVSSLSPEKHKATEKPPPVAMIETRVPTSTQNKTAQSSPGINNSTTTAAIVYQDVVDVPILEAWSAFVIHPKESRHRGGRGRDYHNSNSNDDDSMFLGVEDVYSEHMATTRSHSFCTLSSECDVLSIFTSSTLDD